MAQAKIGSNKPVKIRSTTTDGVLFNIFLVAANVNVPIVASDFNPEKVTVKILLKRGGDITMVNTNLAILGMYSTLLKNRAQWLEGVDLKSSAAGAKAQKQRFFKHSFRSPVHVKGEEVMEITVNVPQDGAFSVNIDTNNSYVEFKEVPVIGYEIGVSTFNSAVIEANSNSESIDMGGHITDVAILNFSENDHTNQVLSTVSLASAYFNRTFNYMDLVANHYHILPDNIDSRIGSSIPMPAGDNTGRVFQWLPPYPQSFYVFKGLKESNLENAKLELTLNGTLVLGSKNYVCYQSLLTDRATIEAANDRMHKHAVETIAKLK